MRVPICAWCPFDDSCGHSPSGEARVCQRARDTRDAWEHEALDTGTPWDRIAFSGAVVVAAFVLGLVAGSGAVWWLCVR